MANIAGEALGGASLLIKGARLLAQRPRLFWLGAVPPLIMSVVFVIGLVVLITQLGTITNAITPFADAWSPTVASVIRALAGVGILGVTVLVMIISFSTLTMAFGAPIYDKISEAVDAELTGQQPEVDESWTSSLSRSLNQSVVLITVSVLAAVPLFLAQFIPVIGQTVVPVVAACFGGWMLCLELLGPSFDRRGLHTLHHRRTAMRARRWRSLGFSVPCFLLLAVPFLAVVVFPVATAGGVLLARDLLGPGDRTEVRR
ncbi:MAG: EI24 domain-containing protein [Microlunatus sp.]|nr:EI24 domain-containing protein [Microlunatus sp.]MDN5771790.1 EI24 domain-containing protein [Microlunatus sp.]